MTEQTDPRKARRASARMLLLMAALASAVVVAAAILAHGGSWDYAGRWAAPPAAWSFLSVSLA